MTATVRPATTSLLMSSLDRLLTTPMKGKSSSTEWGTLALMMALMEFGSRTLDVIVPTSRY